MITTKWHQPRAELHFHAIVQPISSKNIGFPQRFESSNSLVQRKHMYSKTTTVLPKTRRTYTAISIELKTLPVIPDLLMEISLMEIPLMEISLYNVQHCKHCKFINTLFSDFFQGSISTSIAAGDTSDHVVVSGNVLRSHNSSSFLTAGPGRSSSLVVRACPDP